jgi:predicted  nucleic acid-binding Zn-ribbon protein
MNALLQNLLTLQGIEFGEITGKEVEAKAAELRKLIPQPFLGHYDRLRARDKKGVALVRNQVCTGCHMLQPMGKITVVMRGEDIQLCDICGRYLYLEEPAPAAKTPAPAPAPAEEAKPTKKRVGRPRKQKALATAD